MFSVIKWITDQKAYTLNIYTLHIVKTINADQVIILHKINMILDVNIDSGFNPLDIPQTCSSDRACPQFVLTFGVRVSSADHAAASSQTTAEPGAQTEEREVRTYNPTHVQKGKHITKNLYVRYITARWHNHYVFFCTR